MRLQSGGQGVGGGEEGKKFQKSTRDACLTSRLLAALYVPCLHSAFLGISGRQHFGKGNDENIGQGYGSLPQKQDQKQIHLGEELIPFARLTHR